MHLTAYCKRGWPVPNPLTRKIVRVMKLMTLLLFAACLHVSATGFSQITLKATNAPLSKVMKAIEQQSGYRFLYFDADLKAGKTVSVNAQNISLAEALQRCFKEQPFTYIIVEKTIVVKLKPVTTAKPDVPVLNEILLMDITGIVINENDAALAGASIKVKGTSQGTTTDEKGRFSLPGVDENAIIVVSYVGYETKEIAVKKTKNFAIQLIQTNNVLNETVVIGYGTTTRRKNTGSVGSITSEEISKQPIANPLNALQGAIAGVNVYQANGLPGSRVNIEIRGINSLSNGIQPLYIIDGVPFNINDQAQPSGNDLNSLLGIRAANGATNPFSMINPSDIERIDILKDADATAIYGTKAANGVVLITTKKGKAGKTKLDANFYTGSGKVRHEIPMMNLKEYLQMRREAFSNDGIVPTASTAPDLLVWDTTKATNWQERYMGNTAHITDVQLALSGGDNRTKFLVASGYHKESTVFPGDFGSSRISVRANADHYSNDRKFNISLSAIYSYDKTKMPSTDLSSVYNLPPNMPIFNPDGTLFWNANFTNPESYLYQPYFGNTSNFLANSVLKYTILPGLEIKTSLSYMDISLTQNQQRAATTKNPFSGTPTNSANFAWINQHGYTIEPQLNYSKNIAQGKLTALLGTTFQSSLNTGNSIAADNYSNPSLLGTPASAGTYTSITTSYTKYRYNSIFGRLNYDWQSKYILNLNFRRDGSSRFGENHRFGNFASIGGAWIFTNEETIARGLKFLSFGKIRASYGKTGSDQIQDFLYMALYGSSSGTLAYQGNAILQPRGIANPELQWEVNNKFEVGMDLGLLDDKIRLTLNYYKNRTGNQLSFLTLASQAGTNSIQSNFDATIQNSGLEFELNSTNVSSKEFKWKTNFTFTIPKTILVNASESYFFYNPLALGQPLSYVQKYIYKGVDAASGRPIYHSITGDSLTLNPVSPSDLTIAGFFAPQFFGGLGNTFSYKNLELSINLQFLSAEGNVRPGGTPGALTSANMTTFWLDRWKKPGDVNTNPKATTTTSIYTRYGSSDATWGSASYTRLRNVMLSYNFPSKISSKLKMAHLRAFVQGQNLFVWTNRKYQYDPEVAQAINQSSTVMPPLRIFTIGFNCSL